MRATAAGSAAAGPGTANPRDPGLVKAGRLHEHVARHGQVRQAGRALDATWTARPTARSSMPGRVISCTHFA